MRTLIFANGEINNYSFCNKYFTDDCKIIGVDGGIRHIYNLKKIPDLIVGDFDSCDINILNYYKNLNIETLKFSSKKDETDTELSITIAKERYNSNDLIIFGGIGSRIDHTLANCHLLLYALKNGINALLVNENNEVRIINKKSDIKGNIGDLLSIIPASQKVTGITLKGLLYPLNNAEITFESPIGTSNVFVSDIAQIDLKSGYLYVIKSSDL